MRRPNGWWDEYFMGLAEYVAGASKDPSTKVGAVIVRPDRTVASLGYNGFPRGVEDEESRYNDKPTKYAFVVHAEANAILNAKESVENSTIYCTLHPCCECAKLIIQSGIGTVVVRQLPDPEHWQESFQHSRQMFFEAGVVVRQI